MPIFLDLIQHIDVVTVSTWEPAINSAVQLRLFRSTVRSFKIFDFNKICFGNWNGRRRSRHEASAPDLMALAELQELCCCIIRLFIFPAVACGDSSIILPDFPAATIV